MFFLLSTEGSLVNKRDLLALYLVGPTVTRPVQDPLAVWLLNNRLYVLIGTRFWKCLPKLNEGMYLLSKTTDCIVSFLFLQIKKIWHYRQFILFSIQISYQHNSIKLYCILFWSVLNFGLFNFWYGVIFHLFVCRSFSRESYNSRVQGLLSILIKLLFVYDEQLFT